MTGNYRLFVLGAGFSRPAGLPLAFELWEEIRQQGLHLTGRAAKFGEDFMKYLDLEHYLGLRGSDTWSEDGNEGTIVTKYLIAKILARQLNELANVPALYLEFARRSHFSAACARRSSRRVR
jgi:hypothetical protein